MLTRRVCIGYAFVKEKEHKCMCVKTRSDEIDKSKCAQENERCKETDNKRERRKGKRKERARKKNRDRGRERKRKTEEAITLITPDLKKESVVSVCTYMWLCMCVYVHVWT
jgi:hypothetical protein